MGVTIEKHGTWALVIIDHAPVNAIGAAERRGLLEAAQSLASAQGIDRIIVQGRGKIFAAGADAREFDADPVEPHLPDVLALIEQSPVPWIAALNGAALGGGAEIALACRYRIASPAASIGLPEVTLGVVPGAGGTQRLPRLIGVANALPLISEGQVLGAKAALALGIIDQIADDPVGASLALPLETLKARTILSEVSLPQADAGAVTKAQASVGKRMRGQIAPLEAIRLVALSATAPFAAAMHEERATFLKLRQQPQAKALRHVFFAERKARAPGWLADTKPAEVKTAVVAGGGLMGAGIAYALDSAGIHTTIIENDSAAAERARANVARLFDDAVTRGRMSAEAAVQGKQRLGVGIDYAALPPADIAIEAVFEDMAVKQEVFTKLAAALPEQAILASNTSYLDINEIAKVLPDPSRVLGLHFFSPAHIMRLLEIVRGDKTSNKALATGFALAEKLKKTPVLAGVCDGFIGNRILYRYREAADTLLMDGATPWEIDEAMVAFGYPMGPYEMQDLAGLDIAHAQRQRKAATRDPKRRYIPISDRMVQEGRLGRKTGVGWYRYPGGAGKVVDPLIEDLIREEAHFAKVSRRALTPDEICERLLTAMINEAAALLDEGIAQSAADIDLVSVHGYAFPRWRGGLMYYADTLGAGEILARLRRYCAEDPVSWNPSQLIVKILKLTKNLLIFKGVDA